MCVKANTCFKL
nr:unnamed protein product [Callosobruchus chinensis]